MKQTILLICILSGFSAAVAQQTAPLIDSTWMPQVGDKYYTYTLDGPYLGSYPLVPANDTGANTVWNFDSFFYFDSKIRADSFDFALPIMRNIACLNPQAN